MTPADSQEFLRLLQNAPLSLSWWSYVLIGVVGLVGAWLGSYFRQRGETRAIRTDIDQIVANQREITKATEEIRQSLSNEAWYRQRHWEESKAIYFELIQRLNRIADGLWNVLSDGFDAKTGQKRAEALAPSTITKLLSDIDGYLQYTGVAFVFLGGNPSSLLRTFANESKRLNAKLAEDGDAFAYYRGLKEVVDRTYNSLIECAKSDLSGQAK